MCGWRLQGSNLVTQLKPWLLRLSATYRSPSASTLEQLSSRQTSEPRSESSGRVWLWFLSSEEKKNINKLIMLIVFFLFLHSSSNEVVVLEINFAMRFVCLEFGSAAKRKTLISVRLEFKASPNLLIVS